MPRSLLANYPRKTDRFDEMLAENGQLRPAWREFFEHLDRATPAQMRQQLAAAGAALATMKTANN